jgi:hypothetical protein
VFFSAASAFSVVKSAVYRANAEIPPALTETDRLKSVLLGFLCRFGPVGLERERVEGNQAGAGGHERDRHCAQKQRHFVAAELVNSRGWQNRPPKNETNLNRQQERSAAREQSGDQQSSAEHFEKTGDVGEIAGKTIGRKCLERVRGIAEFRISVKHKRCAERHAQNEQPEWIQFVEKSHLEFPRRATF